MAYRRTSISTFALANRAYTNSLVAFHQVDPVTKARLPTLAALYDSPTAGTTQPNPYTLDGDGKFAVPVYCAEPVIALVSGSELGAHETGLWVPSLDDSDVLRAEAAAAAAEAAEGNVNAGIVKASEWADSPFAIEVEPGRFSALHWAEAAETFRDETALIRDNAVTATTAIKDETETLRDQAQAAVGGVRISANDTTAGALTDKLEILIGTAEQPSLDVVNPGGDENLRLTLPVAPDVALIATFL
jgi:hypothetical protein